ncbi:hypothetical protein AJ79_08300 [Helicocarpus griseus UAMH5409]|uniref:Zn(2)-C6 fungal-type domain-containing protein n=1 Tax=Helicocarpus griseus UAMH5409 TaxID=1447875 RepID=A0A2B7WU92_9EURO|nr:hypothetical protein AJ79_08300 [Helicocarpus griseus UAMH5409]
MPYSYDDLNAALDVIREERPKLTGDGLSCRFLADYVKYELRYKDPLQCPSTWVDDDTSGDFDPENRQKKIKRSVKRKAIEAPSTIFEPPTQKIKSDPFVFKFYTPASQCFLAVLAKSEAKSGSSMSSTDIGTSKDTPHPPRKSVPRTSPETAGSEPMADDRHESGKRGNESRISTLPNTELEPSGCRFCWDNYHVCWLPKETGTYPCERCLQGHMDCEDMVPVQHEKQDHAQGECLTPIGSGVCAPQSYQKREAAGGDRNHGLTENDAPAVLQQKTSLPAFSTITPKHNLGPQKGGQDDQQVHTLFSQLGDSGTSQMSTSSFQSLFLQETDQKVSAGHSVTEANSINDKAVVANTDDISLADSIKPSDYSTIILNISSVISRKRRTAGPITEKVWTSFAHPINFTYPPPLNGSRPCHWCHDFIYGMLGLGLKEVEVLDCRDGKGYTELNSSGHVAAGAEPSRMCAKCALQRVGILECTTNPAAHTIVPIEGINPKTFDFARAFNSLFSPEGSARSSSADRWCSICVNPVFYKCSGRTADGGVIDSLLETGLIVPRSCGLLLCGRCAMLMHRFKGRLAPTLEKRKKDKVEMRADIEFLNTDSELYRTYERKAVGFV